MTAAELDARPVRWGFIGAGSIARTALAPAVTAATGAVLHAAAARDRGRAAALPGLVGPAYGSYAELVADPDVEAVYISLANDAHLPWSLACLRAGKPVLCEKPLGLTAAQVEEMAAAAAAARVPLVEASWYRWSPRVRLAQRLLADGAVGAVRHAAAGFTFDGVSPGNYRLDPAKGGGALYDVGCYAVSAVLWAFGGAPATEVAARSDLAPSGVDLGTEAVVSFAGGGDAEIRAGISETGGQWLVVTGADGEIELPGAAYTAREDTELWLSQGRGSERIPVPAADPYRLMVEEFSSVLRGGPGWLLPLAESRATAAVLDAAFASAGAGGQPVPVR